MKILKILRPILLAAGVICLAAAVAPRVMVQGKPDWMMIVLLAICVIAIPISYVQRIKKQQSEMLMLSKHLCRSHLILEDYETTSYNSISSLDVLSALCAEGHRKR